MDEVAISIHALERFVQRTKRKYRHVDECELKNCGECKRISSSIRSWLTNQQVRDEQTDKLVKRFWKSKPFIKPMRETQFIRLKRDEGIIETRDDELVFTVRTDVMPPIIVTVTTFHWGHSSKGKSICENHRTGNRRMR